MSKTILTAEIEVRAARAAHEANRAYCIAIGDDQQPHWEEAGEERQDSALAGVNFLAENPDALPHAQHHEWMQLKLHLGWVLGPVKDVEKKTHPCLVPYGDLPPAQRAKDMIFGEIVRGVLIAAGVITEVECPMLTNPLPLLEQEAPSTPGHMAPIDVSEAPPAA